MGTADFREQGGDFAHEERLAAKEKHNDSKAWLRFADKAQQNPFMRRYCIERRQHGKCAVCGRPISVDIKAHDSQGHHLDYDHECAMEKTIEVPAPSERRPNRKAKYPDCEACYRENPERFGECARRLVYIHPGCHMRVHGIEKGGNNATGGPRVKDACAVKEGGRMVPIEEYMASQNELIDTLKKTTASLNEATACISEMGEKMAAAEKHIASQNEVIASQDELIAVLEKRVSLLEENAARKDKAIALRDETISVLDDASCLWRGAFELMTGHDKRMYEEFRGAANLEAASKLLIEYGREAFERDRTEDAKS